MKGAKKNVVLFGAVAITLLMVSGTIAMAIPRPNESQILGNDVDNYVGPGIYLSGSEQREIISAAINFVDDRDFRILLQEIANEMAYGPVDSNDIEQMIIDNDLDVGTLVPIGDIVAGGHPYSYICGGIINCIRRPLCAVVVLPIPILVLHFHAFFQYSVDNNPNYPVQIKIGGKFIDYEIIGNAVGFWGGCGNNIAPTMGFRCNGAALLIQYRAPGSGQQSSASTQSASGSTPSTSSQTI